MRCRHIFLRVWYSWMDEISKNNLNFHKVARLSNHNNETECRKHFQGPIRRKFLKTLVLKKAAPLIIEISFHP